MMTLLPETDHPSRQNAQNLTNSGFFGQFSDFSSTFFDEMFT